jgi:hypothetical protein
MDERCAVLFVGDTRWLNDCASSSMGFETGVLMVLGSEAKKHPNLTNHAALRRECRADTHKVTREPTE